jgi:hypothetical protein
VAERVFAGRKNDYDLIINISPSPKLPGVHSYMSPEGLVLPRIVPVDSTANDLLGIWIKPIYRQAGLLSPFTDYDTGSYQVIYNAGYMVDNLPAPLHETG